MQEAEFWSHDLSEVVVLFDGESADLVICNFLNGDNRPGNRKTVERRQATILVCWRFDPISGFLRPAASLSKGLLLSQENLVNLNKVAG